MFYSQITSLECAGLILCRGSGRILHFLWRHSPQSSRTEVLFGSKMWTWTKMDLVGHTCKSDLWRPWGISCYSRAQTGGTASGVIKPSSHHFNLIHFIDSLVWAAAQTWWSSCSLSVSCPKTLWLVARRNRESNHKPFGWQMTAVPTEPQPPFMCFHYGSEGRLWYHIIS